MTVRFTWQAREWREAYLLSVGEDRSGGSGMLVAYLVVALVSAGSVADGLLALRDGRGVLLHDSFLPTLLLVCALGSLCAMARGLLRRRGVLRDLPKVPVGEQQVTLREGGWAASSGGSAPVRSWSDVCGQRTGRSVLALLANDGSTVGLPLRVLSADQGGWVRRLLERKVFRPLPQKG